MTDDTAIDEYPYVPIESGDALGVEATIISQKYRWHPKFKLIHSMLIEVDTGVGRYRLFGPVPKALQEYPDDGDMQQGTPFVRIGERISMVCNVVPQEIDPTFGWFKRPRSAQYID